MRLLLVDDDKDFTERVCNLLKSHQCRCDVCHTINDAMLKIHNLNRNYDVIILDSLLDNNRHASDIIISLRSQNCHTPILMLSAVTDVENKVRTLNIGADNYLTKPFNKEEFMAIVLALGRRVFGVSQSTLTCGDLVLNLTDRSLKYCGEQIHITNKEYTLLELLMRNVNTLVNKERFLTYLYDFSISTVNSKIIDVFMCKIRKKIYALKKKYPHTNPPSIVTAWARGYMISNEERIGQNMNKTIEEYTHLNSIQREKKTFI